MRNILALSLLVLALTGCPPTGIVCQPGTARCGEGCADFQQDARHCGSCGNACGTGQQCNAGKCECSTGSVACGGLCTVLDTDAKNCGACGNACNPGQVCESGTCKGDCTLGLNIRCGSSCVSPDNDLNNCGGCGNQCGTGQSCRCGACTYDLVAACFSSGQVVGLSEALVRGSLQSLGSSPAALAFAEDSVLSADGTDNTLYQAVVRAPAGQPLLARSDAKNTIGAVANQVLVDGQFVYVVNAQSGTLQTLQRQYTAVLKADGGPGTGLAFTTLSELPLGTNTYPQGIAKVGNALFVPLYGGYGSGPADAGQKILRFSIEDAGGLALTDTVNLWNLNLHAFDGGSPAPRPWAITTRNGNVYAALNNLNADSYAPEGPGMLAKITGTSLALSGIDLGAECLNPQWVATSGTLLIVSCGGKPTYDPVNYTLTANEHAGIVVVNEADQVTASWVPHCPADAGLADGGTSCPPFLPGRFAVRSGRVYLGDQNVGRVVVLDVSETTLTEVRGLSAPLAVCPLGNTGVANVADILSVPACLSR